ncbi:glutathione hydrolase 1 proenzyme-like [Saccostrea echinata]|uniref:glutathione hydrolase 1 proenzyme-like n=1 Tax=Saccostrea echinata TaxID=191078 RepID=UPI002A840DBB|nr:glutathione hydrolase 1 proenzyme-like [Saccostrea echinata]
MEKERFETSKRKSASIDSMLVISCIVVIGLGVGFMFTNYMIESPECSSSIEGHYRYAAISSDTATCARIGVDLMGRQQGSVVDAAIATLLCQCVENIHSCGIGGGHLMTVYHRKTKTAHTIIAREMAPGGSSEEMFVMGNKSSIEGGLAIGIPGNIKGFYEVWKIGGKLPWRDLFQPAIKKLREGWSVNSLLARAIHKLTESDILLKQKNLRLMVTNPETNEVYTEGEIIKIPGLAKTFEAIANDPHTMYNGSMAKDIVADIREAGGIITEEDLQNYVAVVKEPLVVKLTDNSTIFTPPPPSSGAVYAMIFNIADKYGFTPDSVSTPEKSILTWHRIVEAMKFAYAKRSNLGDPDKESQSFKENINSLIYNMTSSSYAEYVRSKISDSTTQDTIFYGPTYHDSSNTGTSQLSVLAPNGDAVSVTSTINLFFGSKVVGSRTGIIFNNNMDDFSTPNTVSYFGYPASPANFIKPGKRPLSSMCPSIVVDARGHVKLVLGASGGPRIISATALVSIETLWFKYGIKKSIDHKRLHHQLFPPHIMVEDGFDQQIVNGLEKLGHNISISPTSGSKVQGILQLEEGNITANADYRKRGAPDGY